MSSLAIKRHYLITCNSKHTENYTICKLCWLTRIKYRFPLHRYCIRAAIELDGYGVDYFKVQYKRISVVRYFSHNVNVLYRLECTCQQERKDENAACLAVFSSPYLSVTCYTLFNMWFCVIIVAVTIYMHSTNLIRTL